jgi:L-alanine-DL-glutamate epimerase-like enolase superfamily enzyme
MPSIDRLDVSAYTVPTDFPESDGTLEWDRTTLVLVELESHGVLSLGYTYATRATTQLIQDLLAPVVLGSEAMNVDAVWRRMIRAIRNQGRPGIASMAIAAVDCAMWDLKARLLNLPVVTLLGQVREGIDLYGSGGFTSYSIQQLEHQLTEWVESGISRVKMKVGRDASADIDRVSAARRAIGEDAELFVDANGAYDAVQACEQANRFAESRVTWFEEPVSSDELEHLRDIRNAAPRNMEIAAGEYGYDIVYFRRMIEAGAVDVLQADATRCAGISGLLQVAALCDAFAIPLSTHTAPALHLHPCCAIARMRHSEYFHDHVRIERMFFDGFRESVKGRMTPDLSRPGMGLDFKRADAERYRVA